MDRAKIFFYENLFLKTLLLIGYPICFKWDMATFQGVFIMSIFFIGCILGYIIIFCERTIEYLELKDIRNCLQKFKNIYSVNLIAELLLVIYFTFLTLMGLSMLNTKDFLNFFLFLIFLIISIITFIIGLKYYSTKRAELQGIKPRPDILKKLKDILSVSNRIKLERVQNILNLDDKVFDEKIIEWAKEFGFRIDGEYLIVNKEAIAEFIEALDEKFIEWEKKEKDKDGKF